MTVHPDTAQSSDLTHVSLFSGVGGIDLGLERAGIATVAACEIDPDARSVYSRHYPDVPVFDDVTKVTADDLRRSGFVPSRGVLSAGFPCQDLSVAGRRSGLSGARSGLFWHIVRLAAETRPRWIILENVTGLLSAVCPCPGDGACQATDYARRFTCAGQVHPVGPEGCCAGGCFPSHGGVMGTILGAMGECGYGLAYRVLDAQFFGVAQRRRRVFVVCHLGGSGAPPVEILLEPEGSGGHPSPSREEGPDTAHAPARRADGTSAAVVPAVTSKWHKQSGGPAGDETQNLVTQTAYGVSAETPDLATTLVTNEQGGQRTTDISGAYVVDEPIPFDRAQITHPENRSRPEPGDPAPSLAASGQPMVARRVSLHGREGGNQIEVGDVADPADPLRAADGGSSRGMIVTHSLTSEGYDASEDGSSRGTPLVAFDATAGLDMQPSETAYPTIKAGNGTVPAISSEQTQVRRLTPLECERLQGLPDGWTMHGRKATPQPDGTRYRQLGNTVAVPVLTWIARRLVAIDRRDRT
ncbi:MAG: DNA (cytosine-5-)-methyltransferase [Nocardioidaceae bacterium]